MLPRSDVVWRADDPQPARGTIQGDWAYLAEAIAALGYHYLRAVRSIMDAFRR